MDAADLRLLLERTGAYPAIEAASASGALRDVLPVTLFEHIETIYDRLERAADAHFPAIVPLRLAVLLHEESPDSLPSLLSAAGLSELAPTVLGVIGGFGEVWKTSGEEEIAAYVRAHRADLASLLLFELAHEGRPTRAMERAAELGGLAQSFTRWTARLSTTMRQALGAQGISMQRGGSS
jgi:hypothetical protein